MNYAGLVDRAADLACFNAGLFSSERGSPALQLSRWVKAGKVIRLKRGLYTLSEPQRRARFSLPWLANTLYSPSYLSLEYVLADNDLIPERVPVLTSVTRHKTATFQNAMGRFAYRQVKPALFFGFEEVVDEYGTRVLMATPEKALLDTLYLRLHWEPDADFFEASLRLQHLQQLRVARLKRYVVPYQSKKMSAAVRTLLQMKGDL